MKKIFLYVVVFKVEVGKINQELQSVAVKDLLKQAYKASESTDLNYVKDTFLDFCKNQTLKNALIKEQSDSLILVLKNLKIKFSEEELIEKQFHPWDASHIKLESYIKKNLMKDPESYEHVETGYTLENGSLYVQTKIRGNNSFGGKSRMKVFAKCNKENGEIIEIISVDDNY